MTARAASPPVRPPLVSVVTPFFNTRAYLSECIESVLGQSFEDWEYVLVDNVSTDGSTEIAARYAAADPRVRLVRNPAFLTQVGNYNRALQQISPGSRFCKIVEADNRLSPDCLREMVGLALENPGVGVVEAYHMAGGQVRLAWLPPEVTVLPGREACRYQLLHHPDRSIFGPPTSHLFRSDLVRGRDPFYDPDSPLEDHAVLFELLKTSDLGFVPKVLSFVRMDNANESVTRSIAGFGPYLLHALIALKRFGPSCLDEREYRARLKEISSRYFRLLGRAVLKPRGSPFWEYHRAGLRTIGVELTPLLLARSAVMAAAGLALEPRRLFRRIREGKGAGPAPKSGP